MIQRQSGLDSARGVAIALVVLAHFCGIEAVSIPAGNAGVILFFFLSGFLIYRTFDARSYVFRRLFRILPMYWVSVALIYGFETWPAATAWANAFFAAPVFGVPRMSGVYWTLYVEVMFYAIAPFLVWWRPLSYVAPALLAAVWLAPPMAEVAPFYISFCLLGFQIGAWLSGRMPALVVAANAVVVFAVASFCIKVGWWLGPVSAACGLLLIAATKLRVPIPPLEALGRISYSLYLLHAIFGYMLYNVYGVTVAVAVSIAASVVTYFLIEKPFIRLGNRLVAFTGARIQPIPAGGPPVSTPR